MGNVFMGWRRKSGCVLLVMASFMVAMWVRSDFYGDFLRLGPNGSRTWYLASFQGSIKWIESIDVSGYISGSPPFRVSMVERYKSDETLMPIFGGGSDNRFEWQRKVLGVLVGAGTVGVGPNRFSMVLIPYGVITVPLTLLTSVLLLWPSGRAKKQLPQSPN